MFSVSVSDSLSAASDTSLVQDTASPKACSGEIQSAIGPVKNREGTNRPAGSAGNCVIAGHRNVVGGFFHDLPSIAIGDEVILEHGGRPLVYEVYQTLTVTPQDDSVLLSDGTGQLTLITCSSAVEPTHRFVVQARLKSEE